MHAVVFHLLIFIVFYCLVVSDVGICGQKVSFYCGHFSQTIETYRSDVHHREVILIYDSDRRYVKKPRLLLP